MSSSGGMGPEMQIMVKHLCRRIAAKQKVPFALCPFACSHTSLPDSELALGHRSLVKALVYTQQSRTTYPNLPPRGRRIAVLCSLLERTQQQQQQQHYNIKKIEI